MSEMEKSLDAAIFADAEEKQIIKAYKLSGEAKITGILEYLDTLLETVDKTILFAHHQAVLNAVENHFKSKHTSIGYMRIDGQTRGELRHGYVQKFQNDPECRVAILSITAACLGLTLTAASTVVFAEVHWTPALMLQAEDRAHRIGQTASHINIMYLYGESTLDEILFPMVQFKNAIVSTTLDGEKSEFRIGKIEKKKNTQEQEDELLEEDADGFVLRDEKLIEGED